MPNSFAILTPDEVVEFIPNGATVSFSGFSPAGGAKAVPLALARHARREHQNGREYQIRVLTGASSGRCIDEELASAGAISWRSPYQSGDSLRRQINQQQVEYVDLHLSHVPQMVAWGFFGKVDLAVVEATEITLDGRVYLTTSIGASPTYLKYADRVVIELNRRQSARLRELTDIIVLPPPPHRNPIPIFDVMTRIGYPYAVVDPKKVIGIVENDQWDDVKEFDTADKTPAKIGSNVAQFLLEEWKTGRIPEEFLPLQSGVGNIANAVMAALGECLELPAFKMYSEVFQDSLVDLMKKKRVLGASACSLTLTTPKLKEIMENFDFFASRILLRPQEISNNPGVIRQLGVIGINTALEADIYGNVNSSHLYGMDIVNGIGGSGEFTRNGYLSIFTLPSTAKKGKISTIVPMCPHIDNSEHSVQVLATEYGVADLRGLGPVQRARMIISNCAHPRYRDYLYEYLKEARGGHIRHDLARCFELHRNLMVSGEMLPNID